MHLKVEQKIQEYYSNQYFKPLLGSKEFVQRVMERLGQKVKVDGEKPEFRQVFGWKMEEIVQATARVYAKRVVEIGKRRRGKPNEARAMAMYLCRRLGGYKLREIGRVVGLEKYSSVSTAYLRMKERISKERKLNRRARHIENQLIKSQEQS